MKKIIISVFFLIFLIFSSLILYLSIFGYQTDRFNKILESKISNYNKNIKVGLKDIKIKIDLKNFNFFISTKNSEIFFSETKFRIKKVNAYLSLNSLFKRNIIIDSIYISSGEIEIKELKKIASQFKPSTAKKFFMNSVNQGKLNLNIDLDYNDNILISYEIDGIVKNLNAKIENYFLDKTSFIFNYKKNEAEINNLITNFNGVQISKGKFNFKSTENKLIDGEFETNYILDLKNLKDILKNVNFNNYDKFKLEGKNKIKLDIILDETLKLLDYNFKIKGELDKSELQLKNPIINNLLLRPIRNLKIDKTTFELDLSKKRRNLMVASGSYQINKANKQKYKIENNFLKSDQKIKINLDIVEPIKIPIINFSTKDKVYNIVSDINFNENNLSIKNFSFSQDKSKIDLNNLQLESGKIVKLSNLKVKTFQKNKVNNDFIITFGKNIKINGNKLDAIKLLKSIDGNSDSKVLSNINKEVYVNIKEIKTDKLNLLNDFSLIGKIQKGKFTYISSKGKFSENNFLDITLKSDEISKKKILEIFSDLPEPLLKNYSFFKGLSGGKLLFTSIYDDNGSNSKLIIENFKVINAPGLVKLLSLADLRGMADILSGEGLSFERLEIIFENNEKVLTLSELYALGPSVSILMDGYLENKTGLVSLRGTMVPAKTLNKVLSKIPVIGDILIPKEIGEGLFGVSFKMKGKKDNIKTSVNPIKTLTPRFIQKALKKNKPK
tara:strand:- start:1511 stop:3688 length:2178 start_codon:yes stop_codon:yes gene_type:complete